MIEKKRVPEIRFRGFTDDWEQRKPKNIFESISDKGYNNIPVLSATQDRGMVKRDDLDINISHNKINEYTYKRVLPGDFVIHLRSFQGGFAYSDIEGITSPAYTVIRFKYKDEHEDLFWREVFKSENFIKKLESVTYGIRDGRSISFEEFSLLKFRIPSLIEQEHIAKLFDILSESITLHQRELDLYKEMKKTLLNKMFAKNEEKFPEIRFKGFTEDWEQRKLGEYLTLSKELGNRGNNAKKITVKLWGKGVVEKKEYLKGSSNTQYYTRHSGQFMYGKLDFLNAAFGIVPCELDGYESTLDSPAFDITNIKDIFLLNSVLQESFYLKNGLTANGSRKAKRIHEDVFLDMEINVPKIFEQEKIEEILICTDHLITLHQRKIDALKDMKKTLLNKMFM